MKSLLLLHPLPTSWYRTPLAQTTALGCVFLCVFAAYTTLQFYAASTYGPVLAADTIGAVYLSFTVSCLFAPVITNEIGCRSAMSVGILGYACLVVCSLVYFWYGPSSGTRRLVVGGGFVLGCGAALLWTGQGRLLLEYAAVAEEEEEEKRREDLDGNGSSSISDPNQRSKRHGQQQRGKLVGVFWAIFQGSSLLGGTITFLYYKDDENSNEETIHPTGSTSLYFIFLAFLLGGALASQLLLPPSMLRRASNSRAYDHERDLRNNRCDNDTPSPSCSDKVYKNEGTALLDTGTVVNRYPRKGGERMTIAITNHDRVTSEVKKMTDLFFTKPMPALAALFFYTGFNQPYQQATYGNRFFTRRSIGIELIVFHVAEIIGSLYCGRVLDGNGQGFDEMHVPNVAGKKKSDGGKIESDALLKAVDVITLEGRSTTAVASAVRNSRSNMRHKSARWCLTVFVTINTIGNVVAFLEEQKLAANSSIQNSDSSSGRNNEGGGTGITDDDGSGGTIYTNVTPSYDVSNLRSFLWPSFAFACWGFADSQIQVYCYWLLGTLYSTGDAQSRAIGAYKFFQSCGYSLGFYLSPATRLSPLIQLLVSFVVFLVGTLVSLLELPSP